MSTEEMAFEKFPVNGDTFLQTEFLNLKQKFKSTCLIETGTYKGVSSLWFAAHFEKVITMEVNERFYKKALENFKAAGAKNIEAHLGDSRKCLASVLSDFSGDLQKHTSIIFFIDAHWYENPVLRELELISEFSNRTDKQIVVVIHDMKNPHDPTMAYDKYPDQNISYEFEWVKDKLHPIFNNSRHGGFRYYYPKESAGARAGTLICIPAVSAHHTGSCTPIVDDKDIDFSCAEIETLEHHTGRIAFAPIKE